MIAPLFLFILSLVGIAVALLVPGIGDVIMIAAPSAIASLYLLLRAGLLSKPGTQPHLNPARQLRGRRPTRTTKPRRQVIVDGSNVMHWQDNTPQLATLKAVIEHLMQQGLTPGVVFDANAGYKISDQYYHHDAFARMLGLPADQVLVVPKGTPADAYLLEAARLFQAPVVSNDRFRDWQEEFPEVALPGHVIRGGFRDGAMWLEPIPPPRNTD